MTPDGEPQMIEHSNTTPDETFEPRKQFADENVKRGCYKVRGTTELD